MKRVFAVILAVSFAAVAGCLGPSDEEKNLAKDLCPKFIEKNIKSRTSIESKIVDIYPKKGKVVVEVGYRDKYSDDSYSIRLCVFDREAGTIFSPSPMNASEWTK